MPKPPQCPNCTRKYADLKSQTYTSPMVKRRNRKTGHYFWGCNSFPKCRGTRELNWDAIPDVCGADRKLGFDCIKQPNHAGLCRMADPSPVTSWNRGARCGSDRHPGYGCIKRANHTGRCHDKVSKSQEKIMSKFVVGKWYVIRKPSALKSVSTLKSVGAHGPWKYLKTCEWTPGMNLYHESIAECISSIRGGELGLFKDMHSYMFHIDWITGPFDTANEAGGALSTKARWVTQEPKELKFANGAIKITTPAPKHSFTIDDNPVEKTATLDERYDIIVDDIFKDYHDRTSKRKEMNERLSHELSPEEATRMGWQWVLIPLLFAAAFFGPRLLAVCLTGF